MWDPVAAWRLARIISAGRPDVVHTHTAKAGRGRPRRDAARGHPPRPVVVHTFHGHVLRGYFGRAGTLLFQAIETALARATDRLVAVSPEVRDELVGLGVAPPEKFSVVRLGIELEPRVSFEGDVTEVRRRHGIPADKFVVGWFGRMTAVKRTDDLPTMLAGLRERGVDALLLLVGDGDDRELPRAARPRPRPRSVVPVPRLPGGRRAVVRGLRRSRPPPRARARP